MAFIQHLPEIWASFRGKFVDDVMRLGKGGNEHIVMREAEVEGGGVCVGE